jgi:hypothetical protein
MKHLFFTALFVAATSAGFAQSPLKLPSLSPTTKVAQDFSTSSIDITYSRPSMRGRKIFGDVVPYGKAWRTGANSSTKIKFGEDVEIAGQKIKAGEYAIYTIPGKASWEVVLNTGAAGWTADGLPKEFDVARFTVKPVTLETDVQTFTMQVADITFVSCKIEMIWERTKVVLPIVSKNSDRIQQNIESVLNKPATKPYFQAANYYYEMDKNMDLAKSYVDSAIEQDPKAYYMWYLKARIERKLGHKDDAVAAAKKSMEMAKGAALELEYMHNNQKLIDEVNKMRKPKQDAE